jgi:hypothetical protein
MMATNTRRGGKILISWLIPGGFARSTRRLIAVEIRKIGDGAADVAQFFQRLRLGRRE